MRVYAVQSVFAAALRRCSSGSIAPMSALIVLARAGPLAIKVFVIPIAIDRQLTCQVSEHEVPLVIQVPMSLLLGAVLAGFSYWSAAALDATGALLPDPALGMPIALMLIGFFFMITRQNVISQIVGLLVLENGVFLATVAIAPGLPFVIGFLLLLDVLPAVLFYGVFARLIAARAKGTSVEDMNILRG